MDTGQQHIYPLICLEKTLDVPFALSCDTFFDII